MATSDPRFFVSAEQRRRDRPTEWGRLAVPGVQPALRPRSQEKVPYYVMQLTVSFSRWKLLPNLLFREVLRRGNPGLSTATVATLC